MNRRRGVVLIAALIALLVASSFIAEMVRSALLYREEGRALPRLRQAQLLAESAGERARLKLAQDAAYRGEIWSPQLAADSMERPQEGPTTQVMIEIDRQDEEVKQIRIQAIVMGSAHERSLYELELEPSGRTIE